VTSANGRANVAVRVRPASTTAAVPLEGSYDAPAET